MFHLKLVPDAAPNDEGEWVDYGGSVAPDFGMVLKPGHHVVAIRPHFEDRSGESMHQTLMRNLYS